MKKSLNRKIVSSILILVFILIICFCSKKIYLIYKKNQDEKKLMEEREKIAETVVFKEAYKYINDGWYYYINTKKWEEKAGEYSYNYYFSGCNVKYETLDDNYGMYIDPDNSENNYKIPISPPTINTSYRSKNGIMTEETERRALNSFLQDRAWNRKITVEDLSEVEFVNFDKNDIVWLWNDLYDKEYIKDAGLYASLGSCTLRKEKKDKNYYQVGVYFSFGFIKDVRIDYVDQNGKYLTDKAKSAMSTEEVQIYDNIKLIEKEIVEKGSFDVEEKFKDLKNDANYEQIFILLNGLERARGK